MVRCAVPTPLQPPHRASARSRPTPIALLLPLLIALPAGLPAPSAAAIRPLAAELQGAVVARVGAAREPGRPHDPARVLVRLRAGVDPGSALPPGSRPVFARWASVPVESGQSPAAALVAWSRRAEVETVELAYLARVPEVSGQAAAGGLSAKLIPNDPQYPIQWHLRHVQAPEAWELARGEGVRIGIVDTGVARGGEDLLCRTFVDEYDAYADRSGPLAAADDRMGHGTHVAGTLAQCTNNGVGLAGLAFEATLVPVLASNPDNPRDLPDEALARGIVWAAEHGARVVNVSVGTDCGGLPWPECSSSALDEAIALATARGALVVAAVGNSGQSSVAYPANNPQVLAVTALDQDGLAPYPNRGAEVDLAAPGGNIDEDLDGNGRKDVVFQETLGELCRSPQPYVYCGIEGTSMATPHVAAAAALLFSHRPEATAAQVRLALEGSAADLGAPGVDPVFGHGALRVRDALESLDALLAGPQVPAEGAWLTSPEMPGFRAKVRIGGDEPAPRWGRAADDCLVRTICAIGARADQVEVLVRVIGPRPNGFLWPTVLRFTPARVEVWIERTTAPGGVRYYDLPALPREDSELPGLLDRLGFPEA